MKKSIVALGIVLALSGCAAAAAAFLGRHVCRPYSTNKSIYLVKFLCFLCIYPFDAV